MKRFSRKPVPETNILHVEPNLFKIIRYVLELTKNITRNFIFIVLLKYLLRNQQFITTKLIFKRKIK
ncbi:hypothetical protein T10_4770 [Trichinella papuae]|uniref:Uncharacterized protein n=1 Tax=Trichinella papuae TaxID=268474 RepID=A0A0V1MIB0_9BILA|nr:hypothetical protein T10_4770 [Trichinella papuae]